MFDCLDFGPTPRLLTISSSTSSTDIATDIDIDINDI
jgi:hypothetical protein